MTEVINPYDHHRTYERWIIEWCKWCLSKPRDLNPLIDNDGRKDELNQPYDRWYLAGSIGPKSNECITRTCKLPQVRLFFPVIIEVATSLEYKDGNIANLKHRASLEIEEILPSISRPEDWEVTLNERPLITDLHGFRLQSQPFELDLPISNVLNLPPGITAAVTEGFWIMLNPLPSGTHQLHFGTNIGSKKGQRINGETGYHLTVY